MARDLSALAAPLFAEAGIPVSHWSTKGKVLHLLIGRGARTRMIRSTFPPDWSDAACRDEINSLARRYISERQMELV